MATRRQEQARPAAAPRGATRFALIREVISELRKVVWPTREEATRLTVMVIVVAGVVGILLGAIDILFATLIRLIV
jgi:preprotein translocase subunit SecE